jgi:septum formation topological specificity factor MinE
MEMILFQLTLGPILQIYCMKTLILELIMKYFQIKISKKFVNKQKDKNITHFFISKKSLNSL